MKMPKNEDNNFKKNLGETRKQHGSNKKIYIALGACLITVSAIAWSTYQSINTFVSPFKNSSAAKSSNKVSKDTNFSADKNSILNDKDDENLSSKSGKSIPYGKQKENKSKNPEKATEKAQPVSAAPTNIQATYPVDSKEVLKEFSDGKPIYSATMGDWRTHDGTDFKAEVGSKVKAIADGVIKDVYQDPSYGTTVSIEHASGFIAYYSGLDDKKLIEKGKKVKSGETIGIIGKVPCEVSEPAHLHFSVFKDSKFINPMTILKTKPID